MVHLNNMKVILLQSVPKVGKKDEIVSVADGYFQNVLLPKKQAIIATDQAVAALKRSQQNKVAQKEVQHHLLDKMIELIQTKPFIYKAKKNEKGNLFSKVTEHDISNALKREYDIVLDPKLLAIEGVGIKQTGMYIVQVKDGEYIKTFTVTVE